MFFHAIEERLIDPRHAVQIGIRSPVQKAVYDWTIARGVTIITAQDVHELGPSVIAERVAAVVGDAPAYLSFDIDALDPAFAPGTGTPEIGGLGAGKYSDPAPPRKPAFRRHGSRRGGAAL